MVSEPPTLGYERHTSYEHSMWCRGALFTFLAEGKDTGGRFATIEFAPRRGLEPPPHTHAHEDESCMCLMASSPS